jgi:hypothetical protein
MAKKFRTYRCKQSFSADLEYTQYDFVAGKTYTDDGTTVMGVYVAHYFEPAAPDDYTILTYHPDA